MFWKRVPGSTTQWHIDVLEARPGPGSLHSPIYVAFKKDGEEKQIFLDSFAYLVDLLVREFDEDEERNFIGLPPLTVGRATKAIADYFDLGKDFSSDIEFEYLKFIKEEGLAHDRDFITAQYIKELYERSSQLQRKLRASESTPDEDLQEAMTHLEGEDEEEEETTQEE